MEVPKVEKIVISQGVGEAVSDRKLIENAQLMILLKLLVKRRLLLILKKMFLILS